MPILWVVESPLTSPYNLARTLQGEYPIRIFASIASFTKLVRIAARPSPDACLVVVPDGIYDIRAIERRFHEFYPLAPCIFFSESDDGHDTAVLPLSQDPLMQICCVRSLLERPPAAIREGQVTYRELVLDTERSLMRIGAEHEVALTIKEFRLLRLFVAHATRCLSRDAIKQAIWGQLAVSPRTIDVHVSRLRKHLADTGITIENVYGGGYLLR